MPTRYGPIMGMELLGVQAKVDTKMKVIGPKNLSLDLMVHTWDLGPPNKSYKGNIWHMSEMWCLFQGVSHHG